MQHDHQGIMGAKQNSVPHRIKAIAATPPPNPSKTAVESRQCRIGLRKLGICEIKAIIV